MPYDTTVLTKLHKNRLSIPFESHEYLLVGVLTHDPAYSPVGLNHIRPSDPRLNIPGEYVGECRVSRLKTLNDDPGVKAIWLNRKIGPIEFSEDDLFRAYIQDMLEHNIMSDKPLAKETREEFLARDPIGYGECLSAMEKILYKALNYY